MANGNKVAVSAAPAKTAKAAPIRGTAKVARVRSAAEDAQDLALGLRTLEELRTGDHTHVTDAELRARLMTIADAARRVGDAAVKRKLVRALHAAEDAYDGVIGERRLQEMLRNPSMHMGPEESAAFLKEMMGK